jgi:hypothetical protein
MIRKLLFFLYFILITVLSLWPSDSLPDLHLFPHADKIVHAGMYAGFTFLMLWAWPDKLTGYRQFIPLGAVVFWGITMELLQKYGTVDRSLDALDILANIFGFLPGWALWRIFTAIRTRKT